MTNKNINTNGYNFIDLELPSGTLWATANVGASKPTEFGLYFQWGDTIGYTSNQVGETKGKKYFGWDSYKWNINKGKYATYGSKLELKDDAANHYMGGDWHIPSPKQIDELIANTTSKWKRVNGVMGRLFTSKKNEAKSIFIPAAGYLDFGYFEAKNRGCLLWSSKLISSLTCAAKTLDLGRDYAIQGTYYRSAGLSVRGVIG